ncbi:MAG TPA: hypothetical protein VFO18_12065 [Methylomirabilota bacterium]|nr:hypothetical protein [Methylomirabilota bacterium]
MRRALIVAAACLAALAVWPARGEAHSVPTQAEISRAVQVWKRYTECEWSRRFEPCFSLLSKNVRRAWTDTGRSNAEAYAFVRGGEEITFDELRLLRVRKSPGRVVLVVRARGRGPDGAFEQLWEYALLREGAEWKIDGKREGLHEALP